MPGPGSVGFPDPYILGPSFGHKRGQPEQSEAGDENVKMGNAMKFGRNTDLSRFGVDMYHWQEVEVKVNQKLATILLNGEQILELPFQQDIGNIVGFNFNFSGAGSIDYVTLFDRTGKEVYSTRFESGPGFPSG